MIRESLVLSTQELFNYFEQMDKNTNKWSEKKDHASPTEGMGSILGWELRSRMPEVKII